MRQYVSSPLCVAAVVSSLSGLRDPGAPGPRAHWTSPALSKCTGTSLACSLFAETATLYSERHVSEFVAQLAL